MQFKLKKIFKSNSIIIIIIIICTNINLEGLIGLNLSSFEEININTTINFNK